MKDHDETVEDGKIICQLCGEPHHVTSRHLEDKHDGTTRGYDKVTFDEYRERFPDYPVLSPLAERIKEKKLKEKRMKEGEPAKAAYATGKQPLFKVFDIPESTDGMTNRAGKPIEIEVVDPESHPLGYEDFVPEIDADYIFNVSNLKNVLMAFDCGLNPYAYGHAGTGKSTLFEQVCARTNRPMFRVQHTVNTEESHILGQYVVKEGSTVWEPGPLQIAMKHGMVYLADEYDRAMPQVLSVYQPVLEGKALVTKEAPPEWRRIVPHENFRICATGNTNGSGDETGLYPSTALQDFANYERFGMMIRVDWMSESQEVAAIVAKTGVTKTIAKKMVEFAATVRERFAAGEISSPISPRALINAAKIGIRIRRYDRALELAFINRLGSVDQEALRSVAQRYFGE